MTVEELKYALVARHGNFEIRLYAPHIVAETSVNGSFQWVGNVAFRRLAGYIFGNNRQQGTTGSQPGSPEKLAMTAPVIQQAEPQQIAMTAPVYQEGAEKSWVVSFVMPSAYSMETLPEPISPEVKLSRRPEKLMAALRYSGSWRKPAYEKKRKELEGLIEEHGYEATGPALFARYDPPMTIWFRRRNEVLIPVENTIQG